MMMMALLFIWILSYPSSILAIEHHLPEIILDTNDYTKSDLLIEDFRLIYHPLRCLLRTESKYFYLNSFCQLLTRTSLKQFCSFNHSLIMELIYPKNTTIYEIFIRTNQTNCEHRHQHCQFEKNPYRMKLKENQIYKHFLQMKTFSSCLANNFLLSSTNSKKNFDYFSLNSSTGSLSLLQPLDYELTSTWKLVIQAQNEHLIPFYTYVIIDVDDINDCPPVLSWNFPLQTIQIINDTDSFNIEIAIYESKVEQKNIIIANLIASDLDSPLDFDLQINTSIPIPFTIDGPYGDSTYVLLTTGKLDREDQSDHFIELILRDHGKPSLTSTYRLIIHLLDTNDNSPQFDRDVYYVDIQENNFFNTTLLQIFANDSDSNENGRVTYHLHGHTQEYIWIDHQTGIIRTSIQFDYEELKSFAFNVTARDHPKHGLPLKSTAMVVVNIIDQNDNIPKFSVSSYEFSMYENNAPHTYIGQVMAIDADSSALTYAFHNPSMEISALFSISPSEGKLYAHQTFDREQSDYYTFHLIASDGYHVSTPIKIRIQILDINDELPHFLFPNEQNDTLILDRRYWNRNNYICQIEIQDKDLIQTHTLLLIYHINQLKNFDYLIPRSGLIQFDSHRFFLDDQGRLFFNDTILHEGVFYLAFKIIDGEKFYEEKLLKLIVVDQFEHVQSVMKHSDYLGLHLNNRLGYLQYQNARTRQSSALDQSNKYLLLIIFSILTIILIGITLLFVSLIRRKAFREKKKEMINTIPKTNLHVTNCCDLNDASLLMLNKELFNTGHLLNDNCCLLETISEKDNYDQQQKNQTYSSWGLSTRLDTSTFNRLPSDYTVSIVSPVMKACSGTPVSSDDGFCGSSDISDPSITAGQHSQVFSTYRSMYKHPLITNGTDSTRRVRFNLISKEADIEQIYLNRKNLLDKQSINSTVV